MTLDIGNVQRIDDPSAEQLVHYLRFMPPQSPFLILSRADDVYIQALADGDGYRVELCEGKRRKYVHAKFDVAAKIFHAFSRGDDSALQSVAWRRLGVLNDPHSRGYQLTAVIIFLLILVAIILGTIVSEWQK